MPVPPKDPPRHFEARLSFQLDVREQLPRNQFAWLKQQEQAQTNYRCAEPPHNSADGRIRMRKDIQETK